MVTDAEFKQAGQAHQQARGDERNDTRLRDDDDQSHAEQNDDQADNDQRARPWRKPDHCRGKIIAIGIACYSVGGLVSHRDGSAILTAYFPMGFPIAARRSLPP